MIYEVGAFWPLNSGGVAWKWKWKRFIACSSSMLDCTWNIKTLKQEHTIQNGAWWLDVFFNCTNAVVPFPSIW